MADSIKAKQNSQTYLRQIQQEKARYKRELSQAQQQDIKAVRDYYADQNKQLETEAQAAIVEIKQEARDIAAADRDARAEQQAYAAEQKRLDRQSRQIASSDDQASTSSVEKKNFYNAKTQRAPVVQNFQTHETDDFYRVQNRGSRLSDGPGHYVIEAYAPEHEKDNLRVSIQRNKAVVSGQRKFADQADDGQKTMRTNNYQSFREEFAFDRPVSGQGMTRERVGDFVRFIIPKLEATDGSDENT